MFGIIVIGLFRFLYDKYNRKYGDKNFVLETHYDKLHSVLLAAFGISCIIGAIMNTDFVVIFNLEWINYLIVGIAFIYAAATHKRSLMFKPQSSENIEVVGYNLMLNSETKEIDFYNNKMIVKSREDGNYLFDELNISEQDKINFATWIKSKLTMSQIEINWKELD